ncbi:metal ABC transporter substrate-binding protein [Nesterenkonia salmonea]|uniref:metal ABC transporter substrate-binding protein n=1 Tax=Nesterenkonia salmonea TaxID=1804987 RepID=UPI00140A11FD|nr:zinc ABC transporter substrate-binding protein [Nesterenkonia salmonea]
MPYGALTAAATLLITSCGNPTDEDSASPDSEEAASNISVVASTDVYADLASQVAGDTADVQAIVDNPAIDPHSYEATPQDRLRIEEADMLIANGGGYDPFLTSLAESAERDHVLLQALSELNEETDHEDHSDANAPVTESEPDGDEHPEDDDHEEDSNDETEDAHAGHGHEDGDENEHAWYDLALMSDFVNYLGEHLGEFSPENAELYTENAERLSQEINTLDERNRNLDATGTTFMATEPVSAYLLTDAGFEDETDQDFLAAIEHGDDVSPRLLQEALTTVEDLDLLVYNEQTETNQSLQIRRAAEDAGVPILEFSETLPEDANGYVDWMERNVEQLESLIHR